MQSLLIECAVRVSLIAAVIGLVLWVMRIKTAAARHAVWASVVLLMLLLPVGVAWGPKAPLPVLPRGLEQTPVAMPVVDAPVFAPVPMQAKRAAPQPSVWSWPTFLAGVYLFGLCALLLRLVIGTVRVNSLFRKAVVRNGRLTHASCVTPVTVGWTQPSVILPVDWSAWPQARLDAILVHEREHARRPDPLFQWIALLNRAFFWFHPLAWWLEWRLSGLAEEACDAAVLARGHNPRDYSEYLLDLARSVERAGTRIEVLGMAMPGAYLPHRIRRMLSGRPVPRISRPRMVCTVAVCAGAAAILAAGTLVQAQSSSRSKAQPGPVFEVASIRPSKARDTGGFKSKDGGGGGALRPALDHRRFNYTDSFYGLILRAYGIKSCRPLGLGNCAQLSGGPDWLKKDRFDIQARVPDNSPDYTFPQFLEGQATQLQLMLRALLVDRFNLRVHREKKQLAVYALTIGKRGPKLKKSAEAETIQFPDGSFAKNRPLMFTPSAQVNGERMFRLTVKNRSMQEVADTFSIFMGRPVLDRTGLKGEFDFTMEYAADPDASDLPGAELAGPALFTAFQEQAGLKLESTKGTVEVLVIDRAEKPSDN